VRENDEGRAAGASPAPAMSTMTLLSDLCHAPPPLPHHSCWRVCHRWRRVRVC
jgi:hypothetical protein